MANKKYVEIGLDHAEVNQQMINIQWEPHNSENGNYQRQLEKVKIVKKPIIFWCPSKLIWSIDKIAFLLKKL